MSSDDKIYTTQVSASQSLLVRNLIQHKGSQELKQALSGGYRIWAEICLELAHFYGVLECREGASAEEIEKLLSELDELFSENLDFHLEDIRNFPPIKIKITLDFNFENLETILARPALEASWIASINERGEA